jgi:hypothetical protein
MGNDFRTRRLITQSLMLSAIEAERSRKLVTWDAVSDLATLIDTYCLIDEAHVLGRTANVHRGYLDSDISQLLLDGYSHTDYVAGETETLVKSAANFHLWTFLGATNDPVVASVDTKPSSVFQVDELPQRRETDSWQFQWGNDWRIGDSCGSDSDLLSVDDWFPEPTSFFKRSFLYLGYSDVRQIPLTVDVARADLLNEVLNREETLAGRLLNILRESYGQRSTFLDVRSRISPFAAVVFERASNRTTIAKEMDMLRGELTSARDSLRRAEEALSSATYDEQQKAQIKWDAVCTELQRAYGEDPSIVNIRKALKYGDGLGSVADDVTQYESWTKLILGLPVEMIKRVLARRPIIEIHDLRREVPGRVRLYRAIEKLFGTPAQTPASNRWVV